MPACNQCRARKVRCDQQQFQCGNCVRRSVACIYPEPTSSTVDNMPTASTTSATTVATPAASLYSRFRLQQRTRVVQVVEKASDVATDPNADSNHTDGRAGRKRRRLQKTCLVCARAKAKCCGQSPCSRCKSLNVKCDWADNNDRALMLSTSRSPRATLSTEDSPNHTRLSPISLPNDTEDFDNTGQYHNSPVLSDQTASATRSTCSFEKLDDATVRHYIDAYFLYAHTSTFMFPILLKSLVLADWKKRLLHPLLLKCIVSLGVCLAHIDERAEGAEHEVHHNTSPAASPLAISLQDGRDWLADVRRDILLNHLDARPSLSLIQALVILLRYYLLSGQKRIATWNMLSLAARFAYSLALNHEDKSDTLDSATHETRRRAVWAIYAMDRLLCGGTDDLSVCSHASIHIRLPCSEQSYKCGIPSAAPFPGADYGTAASPTNGGHEDMDILAYYLLLLGHRHKILRYTKNLRLGTMNSESTKTELTMLQQGLTEYAQALPAHMQNTPQNMMLMAHASDAEADWYLSLHTLYLQCHCDLYRHAVPRLREALRPEIMQLCSPGYLAGCRSACLDAATALCQLWADARRLEFMRNSSRALFLPVCMYQVAHILFHLRHHLKENEGGITCTSSFARADIVRSAENLQDALHLLGNSRYTPQPGLGKPYIREIKAMVRILQSHQPNEDTSMPFDKSTPSAADSQHLFTLSSRHTFIATLAGDSTDEVEGKEVDNGQEEQSVSVALSPVQFDDTLQAVESSRLETERTANADRVEYIAHESLVQDVIPWGIDVYYDPMLDFALGDNDFIQSYPYETMDFGTGQ